MTKITDYTDDEINAVKMDLNLHVIEYDLNRDLTDAELLRYLDSPAGRTYIARYRAKHWLVSLKDALVAWWRLRR